jgi:hypothetical protein
MTILTNDLIELPQRRLATWLIEPMLRNTAIYLKVALAAAMINIFGLVTSLFTMTVYDRVVPNNAFSSLAALSVGLIILVFFDFLLRILRAYFTDLAGADIDQDNFVGRQGYSGIITAIVCVHGKDGALKNLLIHVTSKNPASELKFADMFAGSKWLLQPPAASLSISESQSHPYLGHHRYHTIQALTILVFCQHRW